MESYPSRATVVGTPICRAFNRCKQIVLDEPSSSESGQSLRGCHSLTPRSIEAGTEVGYEARTHNFFSHYKRFSPRRPNSSTGVSAQLGSYSQATTSSNSTYCSVACLPSNTST